MRYCWSPINTAYLGCLLICDMGICVEVVQAVMLVIKYHYLHLLSLRVGIYM